MWYRFLTFCMLCIAPWPGIWAQEAPAAGEKPSTTEISDVPWTPDALEAKVIYGEDDRIDVYQETDANRLAWAASTCALIYSYKLTQNTDGSYTLSSPSAFTRFSLPPCPEEPFGNQPTAAYCTGFMVGSDLIVTAGHCYNSASLAGTRFIFGFWMADSTTPRLNFAANEVYQGVEVISTSPTGSYDHTLLRVDRPITAPNARPFVLRREGVIQQGEYIGVIGHPTGLPMKIAFGNTYVRNTSSDGYFVANLDTYGGNSGSPVINAATGMLEGILVRGETDYVNMGTCFRSNLVSNDGGRGEDVTRAAVFSALVPLTNGHTATVGLDSNVYTCVDTVVITVTDVDLAGSGNIQASLQSSAGDSETITLLEESAQLGTFTGAIAIEMGAPIPSSMMLEAVHGDQFQVAFNDASGASGEPVLATASASMDCLAPAILQVEQTYLSGVQTRINVSTDEPSRVTVFYGTTCGDFQTAMSSAPAQSHAIALNNLTADTRYYYMVQALDAAGNESIADHQGGCYSFYTYGRLLYFTEYFSASSPVDLQNKQLTLTPIDHPNRYQACMQSVSALPQPAGGAALSVADDGFAEAPLNNGAIFPYYGAAYDRVFVGSNGYVSFGVGDTAFQSFPVNHFTVPRISGLMCDLNPEIRGSIFFNQISDRCVITWLGIPVYDATGAYPAQNAHTFQIELFFNGAIRITWLDLFSTRAVTGLSAGLGIPSDYASMNLSGLSDCGQFQFDGDYHSADTNQDWRISLPELLRVVQFYNVGGYGCDNVSEDGYAPAGAAKDCKPHTGDYLPADWRINLAELLRIVQLYNAGGYRPEASGEDGYRPLP